MKQSTLLGSFITSEKVNAKPSADVEVKGKDALKAAKTKSNISADSATLTSRAKGSKNTGLVNGAGENNPETTLTDTLEVARKKQKEKGNGKRKNNGKLSLSWKENDSSPSPGTEQENVKSVPTEASPEVVAYSEFLSQVTEVTKPTSPAKCDKGKEETITHESKVSERSNEKSSDKDKKPTLESKPRERRNEKPTMSYTDFLSLFKPAPEEIAPNSEELPITTEDNPIIDDTKDMPESKTQSILSFFSKSSKVERSKSNQQSNSVRVIAEVHPGKESVKSMIPPSPLKRNKEGSVTQMPQYIDAIEFLGSETVTAAENGLAESSKFKKRKIKTEVEAQSKKQKVSAEKDEKQGEMSLLPTQGDQDHYSKDSGMVSSSAVQLSVKTSQSQLCFGKGGLKLSKAKQETKEETEIVQNESSEKKKRGRPRKLSDVKVREAPAIGDTSKCCPSSESETISKEVMDTTEAEDAGSTQEASETPPRRRSSRISRPVKPFLIDDVVKVIDDDEEEDIKCKVSQKEKKKKQENQGSSEIVAPSAKKPKGPLASIFTSMKPKEEVRPPPEDPEKVRLRREFMMSGIPDELKRQIATNVPNIALDYPPFPKPSHVQQLNQEIFNSGCSQAPILPVGYINEISELQTSGDAHPSWSILEWDAMQVSYPEQSCQQLPHSQPALSEAQREKLLMKWQQSDPKFKFEKRLTQLSQHLNIPNESGIDAGLQKSVSASTQEVTSSSEDDVVIVDDSKPVEPAKKVASIDPNVCLWSDLHQPVCSEEMVGNTSVLEQLKDWLAEWKKIMQKDIKKACKRSASQTSKSKGRGGWSDDSDFTDSEEEDDRLCNTMLVTGPHGVGKTASVYALAQEMGYKVFEVNSSTLRSGKQILSQLEEATQSHRVAPSKSKQHLSQDTSTTSTGTVEKEKGGSLSKKKANSKSAASGFAALFQTPGQQAGKVTASNSKESKKKIKQNAETSKETPGANLADAALKKTKSTYKKQSKNSDKGAGSAKLTGKSEVPAADEERSQNLATMSLILFDEVDVVFEEDKGFLSTIEHFMASTKIPIILTSIAPASSIDLGAQHDHIVFKRPPLVSVVSYLSCVCLAHGVPVSRRSIEELWQLLDGDIRRCLLYLQFWGQSGGGRGCYHEMKISNEQFSADSGTILVTSEKNILPSSQVSDSSMDVDERLHSSWNGAGSEDDSSSGPFLSLRRPVRRSRRMIVDDDDEEENSNSSNQFTDKGDSNPLELDKRNGDEKRPSESKRKKLSTIKIKEDDAKAIKAANEEHFKAVGITNHTTKNSPVDKEATAGPDLKLHSGLAENALGLENVKLSSQTIGQFIQSSALSFPRTKLDRAMQVVCIADRALTCNSIYHLLLHFTSVPKSDFVKAQLTLPSRPSKLLEKKKRRRILEGSWLDSEGSGEESTNEDVSKLSQEGNVEENDTQVQIEKPSGMMIESGAETKDQVKVEPVKKRESRTSLAMLSDLSRFYDSTSQLDMLETFYDSKDKLRLLSPGTSDDDTSPAASTHCFGCVLPSELPGAATLLASRTLCRNLNARVLTWQNEEQVRAGQAVYAESDSSSWPGELYLPVGTSVPGLWSLGAKSEQKRPLDSATQNVVNCLDVTMLQSNPAIHLDYLPYLRDICRSENMRHLAKTQRRFHHYLDNVGLSLKKSTVACLASTYTEPS